MSRIHVLRQGRASVTFSVVAAEVATTIEVDRGFVRRVYFTVRAMDEWRIRLPTGQPLETIEGQIELQDAVRGVENPDWGSLTHHPRKTPIPESILIQLPVPPEALELLVADTARGVPGRIHLDVQGLEW